MKGGDVLQRESTERGGIADRQVSVCVIAVHQAQERALGDRGRRVLELTQPVETKLSDAIEVRLAQAWPEQDVCEQRRPALRKA